MSKVEVGSVYGRLTVLRLIPDPKNPKAECKCACGKVIRTQRGGLRNGHAKSCGCWGRENQVQAVTKHGKSGTPEYKVFSQMKDRCRRAMNPHFSNYGGRGIRVLYPDFEAFMADVGPRPDGGWIERVDNNGNYEPGNCKWVQPSENQINKRVSKVWIVDGKEYASSKLAADALGVTPSVIVRGCNGYTRGERVFEPRLGWTCRLKDEGSKQ